MVKRRRKTLRESQEMIKEMTEDFKRVRTDTSQVRYCIKKIVKLNKHNLFEYGIYYYTT